MGPAFGYCPFHTGDGGSSWRGLKIVLKTQSSCCCEHSVDQTFTLIFCPEPCQTSADISQSMIHDSNEPRRAWPGLRSHSECAAQRLCKADRQRYGAGYDPRSVQACDGATTRQLGLATVYAAVKRSEGFVANHRALGKGTNP
jgi:hypothetical protein